MLRNSNTIFFIFSTQRAATELELKQLQEDHDRLMERHSGTLTRVSTIVEIFKI